MAYRDEMVRERVAFLSRDAGQLREMRGRDLYETLGSLGLTHGQFMRALDTNVRDYCAQEFGIESKSTLTQADGTYYLAGLGADYLYTVMTQGAPPQKSIQVQADYVTEGVDFVLRDRVHLVPIGEDLFTYGRYEEGELVGVDSPTRARFVREGGRVTGLEVSLDGELEYRVVRVGEAR